MADPKPIVFTDTPKPTATQSGPKPLDFTHVPPASTKLPVERPVQPVCQPQHAAKAPGKQLFGTKEDPRIPAAIAYMESHYTDLIRVPDMRLKLELKVKQLFPLTVDVVTSWCAKALTQQAELTVAVADLARQYSSLNVNELIAKALQSTTTAPSFIDRIRGAGDPLSHKPALMAAKTQLEWMLPKCADAKRSCAESEYRLLANLASFSAAASQTSTTDDALDVAINRRQALMQQSVQQVQMSKAQIESVHQQIMDQLSKIDQLVTITLPAVEAARR